MAKTSDHDDERDQDEELEDESSNEADEDEAHEKPRAAGGHRAHAHAHDEARGHGDDHNPEADEAEDLDDPYWWTPHAVMSALVIAGVLGFFGAFNKVLGFAAAVPENAGEAGAVTERSAAPAAPRPPALTGMRGAEVQMGAKHLLVAYKGGLRAAPSVERSKDDARARATEAAAKAKDTKNKFEDVVKEYSDDATTSARGGDLGRFSKSAMVAEFQSAVAKLKVGEVSDVVETPFGFHVIQRTY
jgi:PPIC-type PPIASE domain